MRGELRIVRRELLEESRQRKPLVRVLAEKNIGLNRFEQRILRELWRNDGRSKVYELAESVKVIGAERGKLAEREVNEKLLPVLRQLRATGAIDAQKEDGQTVLILTKKGRAALLEKDGELREAVDRLKEINACIREMALSDFEKTLFFATFADGTEQSNARGWKHRLVVGSMAADSREVLQAHPAVYIGAAGDVEHALHFPAKEFIFVDASYDPVLVEGMARDMADRLERYGSRKAAVFKEKNGARIELEGGGEKKIIRLVNQGANEFVEENAGKKFSALIAKGVTAFLNQAKKDAGLRKKLVELIADGGFFWECDYRECLFKPEGMQKADEGMLSCQRFLQEGEYIETPAALFQKPFNSSQEKQGM